MPIVLSVICGSICGKLVYEVYDNDVSETLEGKKIYLIQAGAYSSYEKMVDNTLVNNYVYYEDSDGLYKAIVGLTLDYDNVKKISELYGKEVVVSEYFSRDLDLNKKIIEYDDEISNSKSDEEVKKLVLEMLTLYKDKKDSTLVKIVSQIFFLIYDIVDKEVDYGFKVY